MAGVITEKYAASVAPTVTALQSLASSQDWFTGWGSATITNNVNNYQDYLVGATFATAASNRQFGQINIYVVAALNDTPLYPAVAGGTLGTEGAIAFIDSEERDTACRLLASIAIDNTNSAIYTFPQTTIAQLFGGRVPTHFCFYVSHNAGTTTTAGLAASGSALYYTPISTQYT